MWFGSHILCADSLESLSYRHSCPPKLIYFLFQLWAVWSKGKGKVPIVCLCACAVDFEEPHCKWKEEHYSEPLRSGFSRIPTDLRKELSCSSPQKEKFPLNIYNVLSMGTMALWVVWMRSLGTWVKLTQSSLPIRAHNPETEHLTEAAFRVKGDFVDQRSLCWCCGWRG